MAEKKFFENLKDTAQKGLSSVDVNKLKENASAATENLMSKAGQLKDAAVSTKEDITDKLTELDRMLESSVTEYNNVYTLMSDKGLQLYIERSRSLDTFTFVEELINSISNRPKSFDADFEEINTNRQKFTESRDYADRELQAARKAAAGAGAGLAAGASVAFMAPTAAMWIATTFGTASTGAAISTLSGAAATNAALAWLGGGTLVAGGGGMAAGNALLALAGPVGWTIAGATLLSSILLFTARRTKLNKQKNEEILSIKENTESVREMDDKIRALLNETLRLRESLNESLKRSMVLYNADYVTLQDEQKQQLGALVNTTKTLAIMCGKTIGEE